MVRSSFRVLFGLHLKFTQEQRYQISAMQKIGSRQKERAEEIGVHKSTISQEVRRNTGERGYRLKQAHEKAMGRRAKARCRSERQFRQYFPKSTNFSKVTNAKALAAADKLNQHPRKCLAFRTPFEVFFEHQSVALVT